MTIADAVTVLERAKAAYLRELARVDDALQHAVAQDPAVLDRARAVQATYAVEVEARVLEPLLQPATTDS